MALTSPHYKVMDQEMRQISFLIPSPRGSTLAYPSRFSPQADEGCLECFVLVVILCWRLVPSNAQDIFRPEAPAVAYIGRNES